MKLMIGRKVEKAGRPPPGQKREVKEFRKDQKKKKPFSCMPFSVFGEKKMDGGKPEQTVLKIR